MVTAPFIIITYIYSFVCVAHFFQNSCVLCQCLYLSCVLSTFKQFVLVPTTQFSNLPTFYFHWPARSEQSATMGSLMGAIEPTGVLPVRLTRVPACWSLFVWPGSSLQVPVGPCAFTKSIVALPLGTGVTVTLIIFRLQQIGTYVLTCTSRASFVNPVVPFPPSLPSCQKSYRHRNTLHILSNCRELKGSPWEIFWKWFWYYPHI